jgi:hypothetical protein
VTEEQFRNFFTIFLKKFELKKRDFAPQVFGHRSQAADENAKTTKLPSNP